MRKAVAVLNSFVSMILILIMLSSCSMEMAKNGAVDEKEMNTRMAKMIDRELENVLPYIKDEIPPFKSVEGLSGKSIVENTYKEENGRKYLQFCYEVDRATSAEAVVNAARGLISDEDMRELEISVQQLRQNAREIAIEGAKTLTSSQKRAFFKDLRSLVIKTTVLLSAGLVYACMPKVMLWGKVTAACGVSVAAGIVASGVLSIVEYYQFEDDAGLSFEAWIESITKEPYTAWALAASVIATGQTMKRSPILTGIIIAVFSLYQVLDDIKPMLKKYNFNF